MPPPGLRTLQCWLRNCSIKPRRCSSKSAVTTDAPAIHHDVPTIYRLPQELTDMIVDYLFDDPDALTSCACVCRSLNISAQYHLARRRIHVRLPSRVPQRGVAPPDDQKPRPLLSYCTVSDTQAVLELIVQQTGGEPLDAMWSDGPHDTMLHANLCQTLTAFPNLRILKLSGLRLAREPAATDPGFPWAVLELPCLRELHLVALAFDNFWCHTSNARHGRYVPLLERFTVRRCNLASPALKETFRNLHEAKASSISVPLCALDTPVALYNGATADASLAIQLLQATAHSLDHLGLEFVANPSQTSGLFNRKEYTALLEGASRCIGVRSLSLAFSDISSLSSMCHLLKELLTSILERAPLTHIDLAIGVPSTYTFPIGNPHIIRVKLQDLQDIVCSFPQLTHVTVRPYDLRGSIISVREDMQLLSEALSLFRDRNMLHVDLRAVPP